MENRMEKSELRAYFEHDLVRVSRHEAAHATVAAWAWGEGVAEIVLTPHLNTPFMYHLVLGRTGLMRPDFILMDPSNIEQSNLDGPTAMRLVSLAGPVMDCLVTDDRSACTILGSIIKLAEEGFLSLSDLEGIGRLHELQEADVAKVLDILTHRWGRVEARADAAANDFMERYASEIAEFLEISEQEVAA